MIQDVADPRAHLNETIRHAVRIIGESKVRLKVFTEIYRGSRRYKTVSELMRATKLNRVRVLQQGGKLAGNGIVEQIKVDGETAYRKYKIYSHHKDSVLRILRKPNLAEKFPTQQEPRAAKGGIVIRIRSGVTPRARSVTVDDVASFSAVRGIKVDPRIKLHLVPEAKLKSALKRIIGESHDFQDWGGERNDLYTNKLRVRGARVAAAFALKGRATKGPLTPKKMGKNGDQIPRLFGSEAEALFVVYHSKIDESITEQMRVSALAKSMGGRPITYGVIDGDDLNRLYQAYRSAFR